MKSLIANICGWLGTALVIAAYALLSNEALSPAGIAYQAMNAAGGVLLGVNVFHRRAWPAFGLQVVWTLIALFALLRIATSAA